ncbi:MAG: hypothetical protein DRI30_08675 [Chloroflexi bacterium]|nr:MAG: hypothetical protein DRI30_08675 [Chloroflexota bacterium]
MISQIVRLPIGIALGAMLLLVLPTSGDAQNINQKLSNLQVEIVGVSIDMPDGQPLGRGPDGTSYSWDFELTPEDRVATEYLLGIEHFRWAGLPMVPGTEVSLTEGLFGPSRFRLAGRVTSLDIRGNGGRFEIRVRVQWSILDTETSNVIVDNEARGLAKGTALGVRGEQPNVLMDSVIHSLEEFLDEFGVKAIKAARG